MKTWARSVRPPSSGEKYGCGRSGLAANVGRNFLLGKGKMHTLNMQLHQQKAIRRASCAPKYKIADRLHNQFQNFFYFLSKYWHCHQISDRSLFINHRQIPICSRCFGLFLGFIFSPLSLLFSLSISFYLIILGLFLFDTLTQLANLRKSNNLARLTTGFLFSFYIPQASIVIWRLST
jgi:uncharacterized membrane protein